jgi:hypothetical protein
VKSGAVAEHRVVLHKPVVEEDPKSDRAATRTVEELRTPAQARQETPRWKLPRRLINEPHLWHDAVL